MEGSIIQEMHVSVSAKAVDAKGCELQDCPESGPHSDSNDTPEELT